MEVSPSCHLAPTVILGGIKEADVYFLPTLSLASVLVCFLFRKCDDTLPVLFFSVFSLGSIMALCADVKRLSTLKLLLLVLCDLVELCCRVVTNSFEILEGVLLRVLFASQLIDALNLAFLIA